MKTPSCELKIEKMFYAGFCNGLNQWILVANGATFSHVYSELERLQTDLAYEKFDGDLDEARKYLSNFRFETGSYYLNVGEK